MDNSLVTRAGGHHAFKTLYHQFVCKTLSEREHYFYQVIPPSLRLIVPKYGGSLENENGKFLVLENLTQGFMKPSVLDLKIGTRMYSDFATESKMISQRRKCSKTTSRTVGLRFCGCSKYDIEKNCYEKTDKYAGRTDDLFLLTSLIQSFFSISCGDTIDRDSHCIIKCVIEELEKMKEILSALGKSTILLFPPNHICFSKCFP